MKNPAVAHAMDVVKELGEEAAKVRAVKGVTLSIYPGEFTLLMGPSGSGKTTLLSMLGCILAPTSGKIVITGHDTTEMTPDQLARLRREQIGFIFQSYNLFPTLTALENVALSLDIRGIPRAKAEKAAEIALEAVLLGHRLKSYPAKMSGGEQQRVAVARAIVGSPALVLADEPTAALDSENGHAVMALLAEITHRQKRAVLAVTHDPRTLQYADRVLKIEDGRIVDDDRSSHSSAPDAKQPDAKQPGTKQRGARQRGARKRKKISA